MELRQILRLIGSRADSSEWEVRDIECDGGRAQAELERLSETRSRVDGGTLRRLADDLTQVIDGSFSGYERGASQPWIRIRAVDSSAYDIETSDTEVLGRVRECFTAVTDWPPEAYE